MSDLHLFTAIDKAYMSRCIALAEKAKKYTHTNPMVGCVIVHHDKIIGEGYHQRYGGAHAEVEAVANMTPKHKELLPYSTLYVTLEPCSHHGKTPPCADMIVALGIRKVVIGSIDPNPMVAGNGIKILRAQGIDVQLGLQAEETDWLIAKFRANLNQRPYVILKWAKSADNYLGLKGTKTQLSNSFSNTLVHKWRSEVDAIMVGKNTVTVDDPALTVRHYDGDHPIRFVLDSVLSLIEDFAVFDDSAVTYVINELYENLEQQPRKLKIDDTKDIKSVLSSMFQLGVTSVLIEGGAEILKSFIVAGLWDEARIISTKTILNEGVLAPSLEGHLIEKIALGNDTIHIIKNTKSV